MFDRETEREILIAQKDEITEHSVYRKLSESFGDPHNKGVLERIAVDEMKHYDFWKKLTRQEMKPNRWVQWRYFLISKIFGLTFGIKLMEKAESMAQANYEKIGRSIPGVLDLKRDEIEHEKELIALIDEEKLRYVGSMVLGLSDAIVELTGVLAGLTFTLRNTRLIAMTGLITGIAAALSMAASEYLSTKSEESSRDPFKASIYTGVGYMLTVLFLIFPYLLFQGYYFCLGFTFLNAIVVIVLFTYYVSTAKDIPFGKRFLEMVVISFSVAALTFVIGYFVKLFLKVEI
jgi:VIT1/CCC1 family predicted Fe2+/Mn2+ transporter